MTDVLFGSTEPVFEVDGVVQPTLARDIYHLRVSECSEGLRTMELRLRAFGPRDDLDEEGVLYLDGAILDFGKPVKVSIGHTDVEETVFSGAISAIEADFEEGREPEVVVFAEDRLMELRWSRRFHTYEDVSDADIAQEIADEHGLSGDASAEGPTYDVVQQWNMSDLAFLRERASRIQAEVWVEDDTLYFQGRDRRPGSEITLVQGDQLLALTVRADLAHQRTLVKVSGYDADARDVIDEEAGEDAVLAEVSGGVTGVGALESAFGARTSYLARAMPLTSEEATDWSAAAMLRRARKFVTVSGRTSGSPTLRVGSRLTLEGVGAPFEGEGYYVTRMSHTYDLECGYRTHFEAERATINAGAL